MSTKTKRQTGPSRHAQTVKKFTWYYERRGSIEIFHDRHDKTGAWLSTECIVIPWHKLEKSLKRCKGR